MGNGAGQGGTERKKPGIAPGVELGKANGPGAGGDTPEKGTRLAPFISSRAEVVRAVDPLLAGRKKQREDAEHFCPHRPQQWSVYADTRRVGSYRVFQGLGVKEEEELRKLDPQSGLCLDGRFTKSFLKSQPSNRQQGREFFLTRGRKQRLGSIPLLSFRSWVPSPRHSPALFQTRLQLAEKKTSKRAETLASFPHFRQSQGKATKAPK